MLVLMTFGVAFPPLMVVILVAVVIRTFTMQLLVGRVLQLSNNQQINETLRAECSQLRCLYMNSIWVIVPVVTLFYAFILFDTLGDEVGWRAALWLPFTVLALPLFVYIVYRVVILSRTRIRQPAASANRTASVGDSQL